MNSQWARKSSSPSDLNACWTSRDTLDNKAESATHTGTLYTQFTWTWPGGRRGRWSLENIFKGPLRESYWVLLNTWGFVSFKKSTEPIQLQPGYRCLMLHCRLTSMLPALTLLAVADSTTATASYVARRSRTLIIFSRFKTLWRALSSELHGQPVHLMSYGNYTGCR